MWNPIRIEINNLFSHKSSVYEFSQNKCTVIFGKNDTDRNLDNNGAGKSTLFEAICIALTNDSLRSLKKDSFINREEDDCKIVFDLYNPAMKMNLRILRQFFRSNKPAKVEIWENGKLNTQITSVNEANKRIIDLIGITREDLLRYFIISQDNKYTFFTASDAEKKEVMNRITSADMIKPVIDELDLRFKERDVKYKELNDGIRKLTDRVELLNEQKEELLANDNTADELKKMDEKINGVNSEILSVKKSVKEREKIVADLEKDIELKSKQAVDVTDLKSERKKIKQDIEDIDSEISENIRTEKKLKAELEDTIKCPECGHEFIQESELGLSIDEVNSLLGDVNKEIDKLKKKYEEKSKKLKDVIKKINVAEEINNEIDDLQSKKSSAERFIKIKKQEIADLDSRVSRLEKEKAEIKKRKKDDTVLTGIIQRIKDSEAEIKKLSAEIKPIEDEIDKIKFWQFYMGRSGFQTFLANQSIKIIEGITNSYLRKFGVDISVLINGFTVLKSGDVREKIDVFVLNDGVTAEQFIAKSGGERGRVMLAGVLGIQHLINLSTNGKGINLLCLDECFHGVDGKGQENIIKILEKMGITILMITQNVGESFNNENTLYVVKENGVSRYI